MYRVAAIASSVRISTIPDQSSFRIGQQVLFTCMVEPEQAHPVTYQWSNVEYINGDGSSYFNERFNRNYDIRSLRYCMYVCTASLNGTVLGTADKLVEVHGK